MSREEADWITSEDSSRTVRVEVHAERFSRALIKKDLSLETIQQYLRQVRRFEKWWLYGEGKRRSWTPQLFERYRAFLEGKETHPDLKPRALTAKTIKLRMVAIRAYCGYLQQTYHMWKESPAEYVEIKTPNDPLRSESWEASVIRRLVATFDASEAGLRDQAIVYLLATMGVRISECCELNLRDYAERRYWDGQLRWVLRTPSKSYEWDRKTLVVTPGAKRALDRYLAVREAGRPRDPLFARTKPGPRGERRLTPKGVGFRLYRASRTAKIADHGMRAGHTLRLSAVQFAIDNGATNAEVQKMLRVRQLDSAKKHFERSKPPQKVVLGAELRVTQL